MTDSPPSPNRRRSNVGLSMLPSNNSLVEASNSSAMVDWFSSAGALSGLSREEQDVLNSNFGGRRLSDISLNHLSNLVARRLSGCDNGISNDFTRGKGEAVQNMMNMSTMERLIAERQMPSVPPSLTIQDDIDFKLGVIDNVRRRRRSSMSQVSQGDYSQISQVSRRKSLELAALENAARRRRSSMSQKSDFSQTTQQFQRECLELAALEKATRNNSLDLLGDVAVLASSNSSASTGAALPTNNVDGVGDILKNLAASGSPNRSSLDILSEASIALSAKNDRDSKILSQSLRGINNKRQIFPFEKEESNQLFDETAPSATFPELGGGDHCSPFGIRGTTLANESGQQMQHRMKQTAQYPLKQRAQQQQQQQQQQKQQQQEEEIKQQIQQRMQQQAEYEINQQAHQQVQHQAQQEMEHQAHQELKHQAQEELKRKAQQEMKQQARRNMQHQVELEMNQTIEEHRKRQAQQLMEQQTQQQIQRQAQNNALSGQSTQRNRNNTNELFDELNHIELNGANYNRPIQSASYLYGSHESDIGNCKITNTEPKFLPKQSLTDQRLPNPQSPQVLNSSEPLLKDFSKSIQNSQKSQKNIQSWDKKMGLKRSHSATMTKTTQSRNRIKKFLESLTGFPDGSGTRKVGRGPSKKKRKADIDEVSGGFY